MEAADALDCGDSRGYHWWDDEDDNAGIGVGISIGIGPDSGVDNGNCTLSF